MAIAANPAAETTSSSYDAIPYPSYSYSQTHPDRIATIAVLAGMDPAPVEQCRVLEIGCASGGNLLPMAYMLPESEFVGIDLSAAQIAEGRKRVAELHLKNITLHHKSLMDIGADLGKFDYIIAHGVYSWVPAEVRERLLEVCKQHLAPRGLAYVSYNTYPGWHMLGTIRGMMLYHTRNITDPWKKAVHAKDLLSFLTDVAPVDNSVQSLVMKSYATLLKVEMDRLQKHSDAFLLHDELEDENNPVYFYEFAEHAERTGLQYVAEANLAVMLTDDLSDEVKQRLATMANDQVEFEQYIDFIRNRTFRQSLLCHKDVELNREIGIEQLLRFRLASRAVPESSEPDMRTRSVEKFQAPSGATFSTDHPVSKAALVHLTSCWPRALSFMELLDAGRSVVYGDREGVVNRAQAAADAEVLAANLLQAFGHHPELVELHVYAPPAVSDLSSHPATTPVVRLQARELNKVTNLYHERVSVDELTRFLLPLLDGTRDLEALVDAAMNDLVARGVVRIQREGTPVTDPAERRELVAREVEQNLQWLVRAGLLVG